MAVTSNNACRLTVRCAPRMRRLRTGISAIAALSIAAAVAACSSSGSPSSSGTSSGGGLTAVTIARTDADGLQTSVFNVALQEGFFTKEGLKVSVPVLSGDAASIPAVESGAIDFSENTMPPIMVADHNGAQLSVISALSYPPGEILVGKKVASKLHITTNSPMAAKVKALKGLTFAVEDVGGGLEYQLDALLLRYGVAPSSVHVIGISSFSAELTAMSSGTIDGVSIVPPYGNVAQLSQGAVLIGNVWGGQVAGLSSTPYEVIEGRTSFIKANPALTAKVQKAFALALAFMHAHSATVAQINEQVLGSSFAPSAIQQAVGAGAGWPSSPYISSADFAKVASFMKISGLGADTDVSYTQAVAPIAR